MKKETISSDGWHAVSPRRHICMRNEFRVKGWRVRREDKGHCSMTLRVQRLWHPGTLLQPRGWRSPSPPHPHPPTPHAPIPVLELRPQYCNLLLGGWAPTEGAGCPLCPGVVTPSAPPGPAPPSSAHSQLSAAGSCERSSISSGKPLSS